MSGSFRPSSILAPLARTEQFMTSSAGVGEPRVNTVRWTPPATVHAGVLLVHGWQHYCHLGYDTLATRVACIGIAAFAIEYPGHGKSEGLRGYVPSLEVLLSNIVSFSSNIRTRFLPPGAPLFLIGESMGGGLAILASLRAPAGTFDAVMCIAPMVRVSEEMMPNAFLVGVAKVGAFLCPKAALAPVEDVAEKCFRNPDILPLERNDPIRYKERSRLGSAMTGLRILQELERVGHALSVPFAILHGTGDRITSYAASEALFREAPSRDKTLYQYEGAYHALLAEDLDTLEAVWDDMLTWLRDRSDPARRAALSAEVAGTARAAAVLRPAGSNVFAVPGGHVNTSFGFGTHPDLYGATRPTDIAETLPFVAVPLATRS